jgi:hypothetical protein
MQTLAKSWRKEGRKFVARKKASNDVTIVDVAKEAGVSYSTVSRVVNNKSYVKPDTRARVLQAMTRLRYEANLQARSLADGLLILLPRGPEAYLRSLRQRDFPYVLIDQFGIDDNDLTVTAANFEGGYEAVMVGRSSNSLPLKGTFEIVGETAGIKNEKVFSSDVEVR